MAPDALLVMIFTAAAVLLQTALMMVDELVFHRRRKLGLYESFGHPVDSAMFLAAVAVPALGPPDLRSTGVFVALSVASMLVITKDEWVHARECEPVEHWLHSLLFVLHAPVLLGVYLTWRIAPDAVLLRILPFFVGGWMIYQITYWADYHVRRQQRVLRRARRPVV